MKYLESRLLRWSVAPDLSISGSSPDTVDTNECQPGLGFQYSSLTRSRSAHTSVTALEVKGS